jgi:[glutamine synthetase] adenylyltransferase / [glutamine synthetase]-adenylyl-L-tyrosine phosphorylase
VLVRSPDLKEAIEHSADPSAVSGALERIEDAHPGTVDLAEQSPVFRRRFVAVAAASHSLTQALVGDGDLLLPLRDPAATLPTVPDPDDPDPLRALRRWKRLHLLAIAADDLTGAADLPEVGARLARLADGCLAAALAAAMPTPPVPFAVIGMGKLGGGELNYSSDVDVMFVHDGPADEAVRVARAILHAMTANTADGIVFRTDADLRPEGRAGALSRSLAGFESYWRQYAGAWEMQALLKARVAAGDADLGNRFLEAAAVHLWDDVLDPAAIREIQALKVRAEAEMTRRGLQHRELKRGRGGIRDIEFAVQILQLVHGRHDSEIRSPNTLEALAALAEAGYVDEPDAASLDAAYRFLRLAEHRLQLQDERQVHSLPADDGERTWLARVAGYRDLPEASALEQFDAALLDHQRTVRAVHEKVFFRPALAAFAGAGTLSIEAAEARLAAFGFRDASQTRAALRELTAGFSRTSRLLQQLFPLLLDWLSRAPDPDLGLLQLRTVAGSAGQASALARAFRDSPAAAERTCCLLGSSRVVGTAMRRVPEFPALLADDAALAAAKSTATLTHEALDQLAWRSTSDERAAGLRRFKRRELLRIAARDLLGFAALEDVERELTGLADATLEAALRSLAPPVPLAVIGLGRFGGEEMSYASDLDVVYVYEGEGSTDALAAERTVEALNKAVSGLTPEGQAWQIDAQLRPEGKKGALALNLGGYVAYWRDRAQLWEFQAHLKARVVAGDQDVGARFLAALDPFVHREHFGDDEVREIRRMKARIERERIPPGEDPQFHLKLGRGSLSDVEFTVQLLQLRHGAARPGVREPSTKEALAALVEADLLGAEDAGVLWEAYRFLSRARNYRFLQSGFPADSLPADGADLEHLARMLGYLHRPVTMLRDDYRRITRRTRRVFERVFYERPE